MMLWNNPWWLTAIFPAVVIPLLAHLLAQTTRRTWVFPPARLVAMAQRRHRKNLRLRDIALLLLRAAALVAVVLAFAGPSVVLPAGVAGAGGSRRIVLVLDRTASMQAAGAAAIQAADDILAGLVPGRDHAAVVLLDATPTSLLSGMTGNIALLRSRLADVTSTYETAGRLTTILHRFPDATERHVVTDAQGAANLREPGRWQTHLVAGPAANVSVSALQVLPGRPVAGQESAVAAELTYHAQAGRHLPQVDVTFDIDGATVARQAVDLVAGEPTVVAFPWHPESATRAAVVRIVAAPPHDSDNGVAFDDAAHGVVAVQENARVAVVSRADPAALTPTFYIVRAIAPTEHGFATAVIAPEALPTLVRESKPAAVVLVEAGAISQAAWAALRAYARDGGAVLWIAGAGDELTAGHILPIAADLRAELETSGPYRLSDALWTDPVLQAFAGASRTGLLQRRFQTRLKMEPAPEAQVLIRFEDGAPALVARWLGRGRIAAWLAPIAPPASDFALHGSFVALLHELVRRLAPGPAAPRPTMADARALRIPLPEIVAADDIVVLDPDRRPVPPPLSQFGLGGMTIRDRPLLPGAYLAQRLQDDAVLAGGVVAVDPAESRTFPVAIPPPTSGRVVPRSDVHSPAGTDARHPATRAVPLWPHLITLALVLLMVEQVIADRRSGP